MKTETANSLAMLFEVDRATMMRALRNTSPDGERTPGRPKYKVATAARALEYHRANTGRADSRRPGRGNGGEGRVDTNWQGPVLVRLYGDQDAADQALRKLKTIPERRAAAVSMIPLIKRVDQASRERAVANGQDENAANMRADILYQMQLRGLEAVCNWTHEETWTAMNKEV
jgi:hypothetical protein